MSGFVKNGATNVIASGVNNPTIATVTALNTLYCFYWVDAINATIAAPTDSDGQTWSTIKTFANAAGSGGLFGLANANSGTHTLTFATRAAVNGAAIQEVNGYGITGGTPVTASGTAATHTSASYTPSVTNEYVVASMFEAGFQANDALHCTTAAFQGIGSLSDSTPHSCWTVNQNGSTQSCCEGNAQVIASGAALTCAWAWVSSTFAFSIVAGFAPSSGVVNTKSISETSVLADLVPRFTRLFRNLSETSAFSDILAKASSLILKILNESISINDPMVKINQILMNQENVTLTDANSAFTLRTRSIIDSLVAADILSRFALHSRSLSEAIAVIDLLAAVKTGSTVNTKSITESLVLADQLAQFKLLWRTAIDPLSPADVESRYVLASRQQTDSMLISDAEQPFVFRNRTQTDAVGMTDVEQSFRILNRQVQDPFTVIDILLGLHTGSQIHTLSIVDTLVAIDQLLKVQRLMRSQLESFPVLEAIISQFIPFINPNLLTRVHVELGMYDSVYLSASDPVRLGANDPIYLSAA